MPSQHWTARIAYWAILLITLLRAITTWAYRQPAQHIEVGIMLVAVGVILWDYLRQRKLRQRKAAHNA